MANFPTGKSLNTVLSGSVQVLPVTYKENFFIIASSENTGITKIIAGDDNIQIWELAPGASLQLSTLTSRVAATLASNVPLKAQGTLNDKLFGFIA